MEVAGCCNTPLGGGEEEQPGLFKSKAADTSVLLLSPRLCLKAQNQTEDFLIIDSDFYWDECSSSLGMNHIGLTGLFPTSLHLDIQSSCYKLHLRAFWSGRDRDGLTTQRVFSEQIFSLQKQELCWSNTEPGPECCASVSSLSLCGSLTLGRHSQKLPLQDLLLRSLSCSSLQRHMMIIYHVIYPVIITFTCSCFWCWKMGCKSGWKWSLFSLDISGYLIHPFPLSCINWVLSDLSLILWNKKLNKNKRSNLFSYIDK